MQIGSVGRGAQGRPPARFAGYRPGFGARRPNLIQLNPADQQAVVQVEIEIRKFPLAGAHLGHGDVVVAVMFALIRMLVSVRMVEPVRMAMLDRGRAVHMGGVAVAMKPLGVEMHTLRGADVAIRVHMHVEAAELHGQEAYARGDQYRGSHIEHGENCITTIGSCSGQPGGGCREAASCIGGTQKKRPGYTGALGILISNS